MNNNKKLKILFNTTLILLIIIALSSSIFADNEVSEDETTNNTSSNTVRTLTLQEQKNQVQENLQKANEQLEYVETELSDKIISISRIEDQISRYQENLNKVQTDYNKIQNEVEESEKKLKEIQEVYNRKDKSLKDRLVILYEKGMTSYLDVLLSGKTTLDFISNFFLVQTMVENDSKQIKEISQAKQSITKINNELKEKKANLKLIKTEAEKQTVILENTKIILENEKASLNDTESVILSEIDSYKKQEEEINNLISYSISSSSYELQYPGGVMIWPTVSTAYITSPFGSRLHPIQGIVKNHAGIDIGAHMGEPVYAAADGLVIYYGWMSGYGNTVMIDHGISSEGKKVVSLYGHGSEFMPMISVGTLVKKGEQIMKVGSTGNSTGPHVHFEVRENGVAVDPKKYLND